MLQWIFSKEDNKWHCIGSEADHFLCELYVSQKSYGLAYRISNFAVIENENEAHMCQTCKKKYILYRLTHVEVNDSSKWRSEIAPANKRV